MKNTHQQILQLRGLLVLSVTPTRRTFFVSFSRELELDVFLSEFFFFADADVSSSAMEVEPSKQNRLR